jgi:glycosyltransferase involved in cell wall biosynthesis
MRVLAISVIELPSEGHLISGTSLYVSSLIESLREVCDVKFLFLNHTENMRFSLDRDVVLFKKKPIKRFLERQARSVLKGVKTAAWRYYSAELKAYLRNVAPDEFDATVFLEENSAIFEGFLHRKIPRVLVRHNISSGIMKLDQKFGLARARQISQKLLLARFDRWTDKRFAMITVGSLEEVSVLRRISTRALISYLPTISRFDVLTRDRVAKFGKSASTTRIMFIANFKYQPNVEALLWLCCCEKYLPDRLLENLTFVLVGSDLPALPDSCKMKFEALGFVEDILPIVGSCQLAVIPIVSGSGLKLKALTLLSSGLPVVTTSDGVLGIEVKHGLHCLIADDHKTFAESIERLCLDRKLGNFLQDNAFSLVREKYSSKVQNEALTALLSSIVTNRSNDSEVLTAD